MPTNDTPPKAQPIPELVRELLEMEKKATKGWSTLSCKEEAEKNYKRWIQEGESPEQVAWSHPDLFDAERCAGITNDSGDGIVTTDSGVYGPAMDDARLIVALRNSFPEIAQYLLTQEAELTRLREVLLEIQDVCGACNLSAHNQTIIACKSALEIAENALSPSPRATP